MRLRERDKVSMTVHPSAGFDEDVYIWGKGQPIRAALYPDTRALEARVYGDQIRETRILIAERGDAALHVGMGVATAGGAPDYRIQAVDVWGGHQRATLERIPEGRRGDAP